MLDLDERGTTSKFMLTGHHVQDKSTHFDEVMIRVCVIQINAATFRTHCLKLLDNAFGL